MGLQKERGSVPFLNTGGESGAPLSGEEYTQKLNQVLRGMFYPIITDFPEDLELDLLMGIIDGDGSAKLTLDVRNPIQKIVFETFRTSESAYPNITTSNQLRDRGHKEIYRNPNSPSELVRVAGFSIALPKGQGFASDSAETDRVELKAVITKDGSFDFHHWVLSRTIAPRVKPNK